MPTGLITLPLRLGIRGASLALGVTERVAGLAWEAVESFVPGRGGAPSETERPVPRDVEPAGSDDGDSREPEDVARDPRAEFELGDPRVQSREPPPEPEIRAEEPSPVAPPSMPSAEGHVDTEEVFVESFAEPGAEDSAGAQVRIDPPWEAYPDQTADEIIGRLESGSAAELATVELYESAHKARATVLSAVERQLRIRTDAAN
jgi:hypothetical protein